MAEQLTGKTKKSSKKSLLIVLLVILMGGAAGGYYFFMHHSAPAEAADTEAKPVKKTQQPEAEEKHAAAETTAKSKEPVYLALSHSMIVNFPKGAGASLLQVALTFVVDSDETAALLKKHEPMVRNNLMLKINGYSPDNLKTKAGKEALQAVLLQEVNQILLKTAPETTQQVKEVLFTAFVMQ